MTDANLQPIEEPALPRARWKRSAIWLALEAVLIGASVFLGLLGQQWFEDRQHRQQARESLRRFHAEIVSNRTQVQGALRYHAPMQKTVAAWVAADEKGRQAISINVQGVQPPFVEDTAWQLAIATQSLSYIESDLAFQLSRIYMFQGFLNQLSRTVLEAMYANPPSSQPEEFIRDVDLYFSDATSIEPALLKMYDAALSEIDRVLAE